MAEKRPALGRGLSALIPDAPISSQSHVPAEVDIDLLSPNALQPRSEFRDESIGELARSIEEHGVMQPILVRRVDMGYEIIAGERRWRAAQKAGLLRVPVVVREVAGSEEHKLLQMALIENLQREDLNPIDQAMAYNRLAGQFGLTQDEIAQAVGKDRSSIANTVRLLRLPEDVRTKVRSGELSMGHARALLAVEDPARISTLASDAVENGYSVRQVEALVNELKTAAVVPAVGAVRHEKERLDANTLDAQQKMRNSLGTSVRIVRRGKGGHVRIDFKDEPALQRIFERVVGE
jgi:ParB family chromosome partitioning protein